MGKKSGIAWTDASWSPWQGCSKVSDGCKFCYMYRDKKRYGQDPTDIHRSANRTFLSPLRWKDPMTIFVCAWSDFFIKEADEWRDEAWDIIRRCPHHTFLLLTKREERIKQCLPDDWGEGYANCWLGVTGENQKMLDQRMAVLREIPAVVKFLSAEPLIGPLDVEKYIEDLDWLIVAGESGPEARPFHLAWAFDIQKQIEGTDVAFFMKQVGANAVGDSDQPFPTKHRSGEDPEEWPPSLRVREFPTPREVVTKVGLDL
jgi:protein gp37